VYAFDILRDQLRRRILELLADGQQAQPTGPDHVAERTRVNASLLTGGEDRRRRRRNAGVPVACPIGRSTRVSNGGYERLVR
jgi:hypothetical protein